jgi:hypothetical protein
VSQELITLPEVASLHETAVQAIAKGEVVPFKRKRKQGKPRSSRVSSNADIYSQMLPEIAAKVRSLKPDLRHIQVMTPDCVVIRNHPAPWPTR